MSEESSPGESSVHGIDDTIRVAMGFIFGGFTAVHFNLGYGLIIVITLGIVALEVVYAFGSVWYEAWKRTQNNAQ